MMSALQQQQSRTGENNQDLVDEREEREETNRRRRLQREKTRRREEKGEKARQRGRPESNEATRPRREEETVNEDEGGCSHCRGSVATECVYLCQAGHLHRDLPGEGCHHCGRRGESQCKSSFMRILRAGGQSSKGSSRATSAANISS